ncbi:MAG: hypothetical protein IPM42_12205 [Saprospiraceae bacterium]|nr:hypothetical protein [Saprospiraceae bacterium]
MRLYASNYSGISCRLLSRVDKIDSNNSASLHQPSTIKTAVLQISNSAVIDIPSGWEALKEHQNSYRYPPSTSSTIKSATPLLLIYLQAGKH